VWRRRLPSLCLLTQNPFDRGYIRVKEDKENGGRSRSPASRSRSRGRSSSSRSRSRSRASGSRSRSPASSKCAPGKCLSACLPLSPCNMLHRGSSIGCRVPADTQWPAVCDVNIHQVPSILSCGRTCHGACLCRSRSRSKDKDKQKDKSRSPSASRSRSKSPDKNGVSKSRSPEPADEK